MADFYRLADEENEEEEKWWDERSVTMLNDAAFEEQVNDPLLFADFDGSWDDDLPPAYEVNELPLDQSAVVEDLPPAYEDVVEEPNYSSFDPLIAYSSTSMLQPIPRRPRARGYQTRARNRDWGSYIEPDSQADEERVADEVELPTTDRLRAGFERVNEDASEEGQTTAGTFLLFYELRTGRLF
jgi:hypothetical protein